MYIPAAKSLSISETCKNSRDLVLLLKSPIIKTDKKISILNETFGGKIGSISLSFLNLIAKRNRESYVPEIAIAFIHAYKAFKGIVSAEVISAVPLDDASRKSITEFVARFSDKVELTERVDEKIIGGFIVRVGDRQYDDSILNRINNNCRETVICSRYHNILLAR